MNAELAQNPEAKGDKHEAFPVVSVNSRIAGSGMHVPERVIPNSHFASYLETSDEWIRDRTGISERRWVEGTVGASELAEPAARRAIARAGLKPEQIDGIVFATVTPDYVFPSSACFLQQRLGISGGLAFDVNAVCSGFVYALVTADALIAKGLCRRVLVVGADIYSKIINHNDRRTCVLFGDGAGAVVLVAAGGDEATGSAVTGGGGMIRGIYASELGADGSGTDILCTPMGTAAPATPDSLLTDAHYLRMEGREVFKLAVRRLAEINQHVIEANGFSLEQVDYFVSHQANRRILQAMGKNLGIPDEKVLMNVERYGNTSAASIPILLAEAEEQGTLTKGSLVALSAFGGGVTWGAVLLRW
ncbi:MAG: ketoacyl-ACP synthase III [Bdellovibrionales bacterium]|nr:ketoacyl-ACP synthase III [Bdellovibrionales bacterium]